MVLAESSKITTVSDILEAMLRGTAPGIFAPENEDPLMNEIVIMYLLVKKPTLPAICQESVRSMDLKLLKCMKTQFVINS